jgi:flagellar motor switch/type III secretory pathway protein FliN
MFDDLPQLSRSQAALRDEVATRLARRTAWTCPELEPLLGTPLVFDRPQLQPPRRERTDIGPRAQSVHLLLEHATECLSAVVEIDSTLAIQLVWQSLAGLLDPTLAGPRHLDQVEQGVLLYLAARALWALSPEGVGLRVVDLAQPDDWATWRKDAVVIYSVARAGDCAGPVWLHLPPDWATRCRPGSACPTQLWPLLARQPTALHVVVGTLSLSPNQWAAGQPGQRLTLSHTWPGYKGNRPGSLAGVRLPLSQPRWVARRSASQELTIVTNADERNRTMVEEIHDERPFESEPLADIPLELTVELGRIATTVEEALTLCPGKTLRLGRRPGDLVDLRIGPRLVARAELVQIDDELGIILRELGSGTHATKASPAQERS